MIGFFFWSFIAFVIYTYAGYPILIGLLARCRPRTRWSDPSQLPSVTLLIAAYNEEESIGAKIENSLALDYPRDRLQILVAADGSNDRTREIVAACADRGIELSYVPQRSGKMAAINRAMQLVRGEIVIFSDANNHYAAECIYRLVAPFADPSVGAVTGAKRIIKEERGLSAMGALYWHYESFIKESESRLGSCVAAVGEIFAIRRSLFRAAPSYIINDDFYMLMDVLKTGKRVIYCPDALSFEHTSSKASDEVERWSRIVAGRYQAMVLAPRLFPWRRPFLVWQVISHKFCRPFVAIALLCAFACSILPIIWPPVPGHFNMFRLAPPYNVILFLPQALLWGIGLAGMYVEWPGRIGKLFYLPTFLLNANWAALVGLWRGMRKQQSVLWNRVQREAGTNVSGLALQSIQNQKSIQANKESLEPTDRLTGRIIVLHLRTSSGGGGGPDKTIYNTGRLIDSTRFKYITIYLRRRNRSVASLIARANQAGLEYHEIPGGPFFDIIQIWRVWRLIKSRHVDILHCHDPKSDIYGLLLRLLCPGLRLMSTMHGWLPGKRRRFSNRVDLWALARYDAVLAVSSHTGRLAENQGIRNSLVVHNAIDSDEWCPGDISVLRNSLPAKESGEQWIGFMGRLSREKGGKEFVRLAARVGASPSRYLFLVAGEGPERAHMESLAGELGIADRIRFLGHLESEALLNFSRSLDVLVSPSWTEGLPNNVLEACATGTPVVATDVGGTGEIITHGLNGFLAPAGNIEELARCVQAVLSDPELARSMAREARRIVERKFSMRERTRRVEDIYTSLMAPRRAKSEDIETGMVNS